MKSTFRVLTSLAALSAAVFVSGASLAQEPPNGAPPASGAAQDHWAEHMREHAEARARALHDILNIRPDQEAAFQAFIASMKPPEGHEGMHEHHGMGDQSHLTTPERLDRMAARMAERQAAFQRRAAAVKTFYAALSPEQQRAFDALAGLIGEGHHGDDGRGGRDHFGPPHPED